jgi:hypothetical protein
VKARTHAHRLKTRFGGRPHVGVVTHFDGLDVPAAVARIRAVAAALDLPLQGAVEEIEGRRVFSAAAPVRRAGGLEVWLVASEQPAVGCTVEARVFHPIEQSAEADEYLAELSRRLAGGPPENHATGKDGS